MQVVAAERRAVAALRKMPEVIGFRALSAC